MYNLSKIGFLISLRDLYATLTYSFGWISIQNKR